MRGKSELLRLIVFLGLFFFFAGLLVYSLLKVRYDVSGSGRTELNIIEKTTTQSIERDEDGAFVYTVKPGASEEEPCPT